MIQSKSSILTIRFKNLSKLGDPIEKLDEIINWKEFRRPLERIILRKNKTSRVVSIYMIAF